MIERKIEICIGTNEAKVLRVRLSLLLVDGDNILGRHYHSMELAPGDDLAKAKALINADLQAGWIQGQVWPLIPDDKWADVEAHAAIAWK